MKISKIQVFVAESIGVATLVCTVVGSGIMAAFLTRDIALALLINALATIFMLSILITLIGPISGAHLNPVISMVERLRGQLTNTELLIYVAAQVIGGIAGTLVANLMFNLEVIQISSYERISTGSLIGEVIATAGLVAVIGILLGTDRSNLIALIVPLWIGAAIIFTSSTSFANPAVTIARMFTDTFAGIAPSSVGPFVLAQLIGGALGLQISNMAIQNKK